MQATFFVFRKREEGLLLAASITYFLLQIAAWVVIFALYAVLGFSAFSAAQFDPNAPPPVGAIIGIGLIGYLVTPFVFFLLQAAYESACLRWLIRGERAGLFGFSLNADTWRIYSSYWLWAIFIVVGYFLFAIVVAALSALGFAFGSDSPLVAGLWALASLLIAVGAVAYLAVRTAPAAATSVGRRSFAFFDSWKVSNNRFWALFGSYFLLFLIWAIVMLVLIGVMFVGAYAPIFEAAYAGSDPEAAGAAITEALSQPGALAAFLGALLAMMLVGPVFSLLGFGVNARAVLVAAQDGKIDGVINADIARTFD